MKFIFYFLIVIAASCVGFFVHVMTVEWLQPWISAQMNGQTVVSSWSVRYVAMFTSVEYGIATLVLYFLLRDKVLKYGKFISFLILSALLLGVHGALIRQPLMDWLIGNPLSVTLLQNGMKWLVWLLISLIVVYGVEFVLGKSANKAFKGDSNRVP